MRTLDLVPTRQREDPVSHLIPADKSRRLVALRRYEILDTAPEIAYDEIVELAALLWTDRVMPSLIRDDHE